MGSGFIVRELVGSATPIYGILHIATVWIKGKKRKRKDTH